MSEADMDVKEELGLHRRRGSHQETREHNVRNQTV